MVAMKAMKHKRKLMQPTQKARGPTIPLGAYRKIAQQIKLDENMIFFVIDAMMEFAMDKLKQNGSFTFDLGRDICLKLKSRKTTKTKKMRKKKEKTGDADDPENPWANMSSSEAEEAN